MRTPDSGKEPLAAPARPSRMRRLATILAASTLTLAACGSGNETGRDDLATDPAPTTSSPTASPTVGTYPDFAPTSYTYTLVVTCYCPGAGTPIAVTVEDDEVVDAVYGEDSGGRGGDLAGQQAEDPFRLSIDDVIAEANDTAAHQVDVDWPAGQDFPTSVFVDGADEVADDERGFEVSDVVVSGS